MKNGRRLGAHSPPKPYQPPEQPQGKINVTDLDSRNVKTPRGWLQGYNAQAVATEDQIVIAAEVHVSSADFGQLEPMVTAARRELDRAGIEQPPAVVLADAGYWHQDQMQHLAGEGLTVLVPPDANKRAGARPGWNGGHYAFMRRVLDSEPGGALYAKRQGMIEPIFADTKFNRRIDRFLRRGRAAARSEWRLTHAAHNLLKLWRHATAPATA
jgi:Transposase DDE domain